MCLEPSCVHYLIRRAELNTFTKIQFNVSSPLQSWSKVVVCASTPRKYPRSGYFLVFTLDFLISVDPQISIDPGKIGKNNKRRPSNKHRPWKNLAKIIIQAY